MPRGPRTQAGLDAVTATIEAVNAARGNIRRIPGEATGTYSITPAEPETRALAERIYEVLDGEGLGHVRPADRVAVELLAVALRRVHQAERSIERAGLITRRGQVRPVAHLLVQLLREARAFTETLGMTPVARARLGLDTARAFDVAAALAALPHRDGVDRPPEARDTGEVANVVDPESQGEVPVSPSRPVTSEGHGGVP